MRHIATISIFTMLAATLAHGNDLALDSFTPVAGAGAATGGDLSLVVIIGQPESGSSAGGDWGVEGGLPPVPEEEPCPADLTGDGHVGSTDLVFLILSWGTPGVLGNEDINGDGTVSSQDLVLLILDWGPCA